MASVREQVFDSAFLARLEQLHILAKRLAARGAPGLRRSRRMGDGLELADHRDYTAGDDLRFIDWPYYARMEKLLLRLFHEHSEADVVIMLDCSASMAPGGQRAKFDYARRTAAALAYVAMGSLERVILAPFAQEALAPLRTGRNRGQILAVLDYLAGLDCGGPTGLGRSVQQVLAGHDVRGTVLLLSDLVDCEDELSDALAHLRANGEPVVVQVLEGPESRGLDGPMVLQAAESGQELALNVTPELLASYRLRCEEFRAGCERTCLSRGATYVAADTAKPFEMLVLQTLRRAGVLS